MGKHKTKKHRRHHRVGAMKMNASSPVVKLLAVGAGFLLDKYAGINDQIDKAVNAGKPATATTPAVPPSKTTDTIITVAEVGLGGYLLMHKKKPSLIKTGVGGVLAGMGLHKALKAAGVISGYQAVPVIGRRRMSGYQSTPVIAGVPPQLAGVPPQLQGFRVNGYASQGSGVMGNVKDSDTVDNGSGLAYNHSGFMG